MAAGGMRVVCKMRLTILNHKISQMKKYFLFLGLTAVLAGGYSCKGKNDKPADDTTTTTTTTAPAPTAPVEVAPDETLRRGVEDATKDVKGLTTRVEDGVIYLSGTISRDDNMRITPTLNSLNPKKIDRTNLTVQ
jgi:hypothetical protein